MPGNSLPTRSAALRKMDDAKEQRRHAWEIALRRAQGIGTKLREQLPETQLDRLQRRFDEERAAALSATRKGLLREATERPLRGVIPWECSNGG